MNDNNHTTTTDEPLMSVHEESLLRSALNRRAVPAPDVDEEWGKLFSEESFSEERGERKEESPLEERGERKEEREMALGRVFHIFLAVAAIVALLWVVVPPILKDKEKVTAQHDKEQIDSVGARQSKNVAESKTYTEKEEREIAETITPTTVSVPKASMKKLTLPDGTVVWLNAGSELKYAFTKTEGERRVILKGEGYFDVRHDAERPFVVEADGMTITDVGTEFNVKAYEGGKPEVVVVEGSVKASLSADNFCVLGAGKRAQASGGKIVVTTVDTYPYTQWRNGLFYFHDTKLLDAVKEIGRWYGCNIVIESNDDLATRIHFVAERSLPLKQIVSQLNDIDGVDINCGNGELVVK